MSHDRSDMVSTYNHIWTTIQKYVFFLPHDLSDMAKTFINLPHSFYLVFADFHSITILVVCRMVSVTVWGFRERQLFKIRPPKPTVHFIFDKLVDLSG